MSANQVGTVYQKIIDDVINDSASTFDEDGVERRLLDDLRNTWQSKLSLRHVADMPWDPPPAPLPLQMPSAPAPVSTPTPAPPPPAVKPEPVIKQEPTYSDYPPSVPASQHAAGIQRTAQFIQDKFGSAANGSLTALQDKDAPRSSQPPAQAARSTATPGTAAPAQQAEQAQQAQQARQAQQTQQTGATMPMNLTTDAARQHYNRMLAEQMKSQQARLAAQRSVPNGQTDGADEWKAFVAERRALSDEAILAGDLTIRQRVRQMASEMEGGGLMLPSSQIRIPKVPVRRDPKLKRSQVDGPDSDDDKKADEDDDAINSDLDDPDDEFGRGEDDEDDGGENMICLYDKVQRVKNKWKCTLKDGILSTGGKEYVFGKAQGEFEW